MVEEVLGYGADGSGEHVLLDVEKRGHDTMWVARELARFADISPVGVGYAGLKDRHAVTRQAFSVQLAGRDEPDWSAFPHDGVRILSSARHRRKLKRGAMAGNRFTLTLRDASGSHEHAMRLLERVRERGVPNYFGEQRFGRAGGNVDRARAIFAGRRVDRRERSMLLSAARSYLFNAVLADRVGQGCWDTPMEGEAWSLAGSRSWFGGQAFDDDLATRLHHGDIHPSGPLWGRGASPASAAVLALETSVLAPHEDLREGLEKAGMEHQRRALRVIPDALAWERPDASTLVLRFGLPSGSYATSLVRELALLRG